MIATKFHFDQLIYLAQAVCNSLGSVRLQGHDFFLRLKKDRKEVNNPLFAFA